MKRGFIYLVVIMTVFFDVINVAKSSRTNKISTNDLGGFGRMRENLATDTGPDRKKIRIDKL